MVDTDVMLRQQSLFPEFGEGFLLDHAGSIINDPKIALVEIIANCWDAGADTVEIEVPKKLQGKLEIIDNGSGMTEGEFSSIWPVLSYNRREHQGIDVIFPSSNINSNRKVFGLNGKGRHGMFCFANNYFVETIKDGEKSIFEINRALKRDQAPYHINLIDKSTAIKEDHGTRIFTSIEKNLLSEEEICDIIGSKFIADPSFSIFVNGSQIELTTISHLMKKHKISLSDFGDIEIIIVDTASISRTTKQHGVAWWVNNRLLGNIGWNMLDGTKYLDGRITKAKRYTIVVKADVLHDYILEDWTGFKKNSDRINKAIQIIEKKISDILRELFKDIFRENKIIAITDNSDSLRNLTPQSRRHIGQFINQVQEKIPTFKAEYLSSTVEILAKLEQSRSGFALLQQLSKLGPNDLDELNHILENWTVQEASTVLEELDKRLKLIENLEKLMDNPTSDELHTLQPLFEMGLWIFGPEYESVEFTSNQALSTVLKKLLKDKSTNLENPSRRPDFIAIPDASIGVYSCDNYEEGEVSGIKKVLIVELKRGGFKITRKEVRQADDYEIELRKSGKISKDTEVLIFVLGSNLGEDAREPSKKGEPTNTCIYPRTYSTVLRQAHARTFNLSSKIKEKRLSMPLVDEDLEQLVCGVHSQIKIEYHDESEE